MEYLGAWGKLIHEKNLKAKISYQTPFKGRWETEMKGLLKGERGSRKEGGGGGERRVGIGVMRKKEKGELKGRSGKLMEEGGMGGVRRT
jgi:hypothetical protein